MNRPVRSQRHAPHADDHERLVAELERVILEILGRRDGTMCPSEAARAAAGDDWRDLMDATREAGRRLEAEGRITVLQGGRAIDAATARGAIRYGIRRDG